MRAKIFCTRHRLSENFQSICRVPNQAFLATQNRPPSAPRKQPEIFCFNFAIRNQWLIVLDD